MTDGERAALYVEFIRWTRASGALEAALDEGPTGDLSLALARVAEALETPEVRAGLSKALRELKAMGFGVEKKPDLRVIKGGQE